MDLLRPICGRNRNEIILMEYEGFLINPTEYMILKMQSKNKEMWIKRFPKLNDYFGLTPEQLYEATYFFPPDIFLQILGDFKEDIPYNDYLLEINTYDIPAVDEIRARTVYEYTLGKLIREEFVKEIIIVARSIILSKTDGKFLLKSVIGDAYKSKFHVLFAKTDEDVLDIIKDTDIDRKITSVFLNNSKLMMKIHSSYPDKNRFFILRKNYTNAKMDLETKMTTGLVSPEDFYTKNGINMCYSDSRLMNVNNIVDPQPLG